jgi:hypothetical protein
MAIVAIFTRYAWRQNPARFLACAALGMAFGLLVAGHFGEFHAAAPRGPYGSAYILGFMLGGVLVAGMPLFVILSVLRGGRRVARRRLP